MYDECKKIYQLAFGKNEEKCNFYCDPSKVFARLKEDHPDY